MALALKLVTEPAVVTLPMELLPEIVNHMAPSDPRAIPIGPSMPVPP